MMRRSLFSLLLFIPFTSYANCPSVETIKNANFTFASPANVRQFDVGGHLYDKYNIFSQVWSIKAYAFDGSNQEQALMLANKSLHESNIEQVNALPRTTRWGDAYCTYRLKVVEGDQITEHKIIAQTDVD